MIARFAQNGRMLSEKWAVDFTDVRCCRCLEKNGLRPVAEQFVCQAHDPHRGGR